MHAQLIQWCKVRNPWIVVFHYPVYPWILSCMIHYASILSKTCTIKPPVHTTTPSCSTKSHGTSLHIRSDTPTCPCICVFVIRRTMGRR
jgi:hypothetical protein